MYGRQDLNALSNTLFILLFLSLFPPPFSVSSSPLPPPTGNKPYGISPLLPPSLVPAAGGIW